MRSAANRPRRLGLVRLACTAAGVAAIVAVASAQPREDDVPLPPRIDRAAPPERIPDPVAILNARPSAVGEPGENALPRPPNAARLAPRAADRPVSTIDEIVVIGDSSGLPDLGSRWRARQEAAEELENGRIHVTFLPLYDPTRPTSFENPFVFNPEFNRIGYIDLFRLRFGKRSAPEPRD